jgi:hypothetical protein
VPDLRVEHTEPSTERPTAVSRDGGSPNQGGDEAPSHREPQHAGAEELAVALAASDRGNSLMARFEVGSGGEPLIRIIDQVRGDTVALITPDELKALAEDTGLPPGLLMQVSS